MMPIQFNFTRRFAFLPMACLLMVLLFAAGCKGNQAENPQLEKAKRLIEGGNYEAAFLELNQALMAAPTDPQVHLNLGWLYLYTDDVPHAQQELKKLEELAPDLADTYHLRGSLKVHSAQQAKENPAKAKKDYEFAIDQFKKSLDRNAKNDQTYFDLASSLIALERYDDALHVLNQGFEHIPGNDLETQVNFQIASCTAHAKLGMLEEAIADCSQAKEFTHNPESRQRIEEMIENMQLMSPSSKAKASQSEEDAFIDAAVAD